MTAEELWKLIGQIDAPDERAAEAARERWSHVAKPLDSLGLLEAAIVKVAAAKGSADICLDKKALVVMCADNGVVEEGVTQTGQEVTAVVTGNFTRGDSCVCIMAERAGVDVFPVDIGVAFPIEKGKKYPLIHRKVRKGTRNFLKEPAMTREEAIQAVSAGVELVRELKDRGYGMIATGEMGIGNTTTSSAVASVLTGEPPETMTGKGAGLSDEGLLRKISVIKEGITQRKPDPSDALDVLAKVGGLDLAGLTGIFLGGAIFHVPVVVDGFISASAALAAASINRNVSSYMLASHMSAEPASRLLMEKLGLEPVILAGMCLGEGTGAVAFLPLLDMAAEIYKKMSTFQEIHIKEYKPL